MDLAKSLSSNFANASSVEVIPGYLLPAQYESDGWCFIDGVLGVVDKVLVKSYIKLCMLDAETSTPESSLLSLLATHENVKVVNARKRMCLSGEISPADELHTSTVILKSHLYKHSKSPMLWHHRRWLIETFELSSSLMEEYRVVEEAAVHHPKNYYAWSHLRWAYEYFDKPARDIKQLYSSLKDLCSRNLGDVSMWTFLHWLDAEDLEEFAKQLNEQFPGHEAVLSSLKTVSN